MTPRLPYPRAVVTALLAVFLGCLTMLAAEPTPKTFDVPAGQAPATLRQFIDQAGVQVLYSADEVQGVATHEVKGPYTPIEAIQALLAGTGLEIRETKNGAIAINRTLAPNAQRAIASTSDRPESAPRTETNENGEKVVKMQTFEVFERKTLNMDVRRTRDDPQAYVVFDREVIDQSGAANVEDFLKQRLTMNTTMQSNSQQDLGDGTSTINLRGLGSNETLILVDGRRLAGAASGNGILNSAGSTTQPDINGIPIAAIERIEVLPSSASAIYGGAALGGVVNVILKREFNGGELRYGFNSPLDAGAHQENVSLLYGLTLSGGRTQVMLGGQSSDQTPLLLQDRRGLYQRGINQFLQNAPTILYTVGSPFRGATPNISATTNLVLDDGTPLNSRNTHLSSGTAPGANLGPQLLANAGSYNFDLASGVGLRGLHSQFGPTSRTKSLFGTIRQTLPHDAQVFFEFAYAGNGTSQNRNPLDSGSFLIPGNAITNPFVQTVRVNFPSDVSVPYTSDSITRRAAIGAIIPLVNKWTLEADFTWSANDYTQGYYHGYADLSALTRALTGGALNPFVDTLAYPLNLAPYLTASETYSGRATLNDLSVRVGGLIHEFLGGPMTWTSGLEHRREGFDRAQLDDSFPLTPANNSETVALGQLQDTNSLYAETRIPLLSPANGVRFVSSLELQLAVRSEFYTTHNSPQYADVLPDGYHTITHYSRTSPTVAVKYDPLPALSFRASYATAFLPPTAAQLLADPRLFDSFGDTVFDPQLNQTYSGWSIRQGGNPHLKPQTAESWTYGVIWQPKEGPLEGLRVNFDYYDIRQPNYITTPSEQQLVSDPAFADHITRNPATGMISVIDVTPVNATEYHTSGFDAGVDYRRKTPFGTLQATFAGTWIRRDLRQSALGSPFLEYAGYPNDGGEAKFKGFSVLSWDRGGWSAAWTTNYVSSYQQIGSPGSPSFAQFGTVFARTIAAQGGNTVSSQIYHDLMLGYRFARTREGGIRRAIDGLSVQLGVKNIFNTYPSFDAANSIYYYSSFGDPRLRVFWASLKKAF